jgi:hypothetical protein
MMKHLYLVALAGAVVMATTAGPAHGYFLEQTIPVLPTPDNSVGGNFNTFDISFFDPATQLDYVADRSNAAVDVFSGASETLVGQVGGTGHLFAGQKATNAASGPDGVVIGNPNQLFAGDGNSTLKAFNITPSPFSYAPIPPTTALGASGINTGGSFRVDEMAFDPHDHIVAAGNNADNPPFVTLVDANTSTILHQIKFDGGVNGTPKGVTGIEQPVWDKNTQSFFVATVQDPNPGGITQLDINGNVLAFYNLASFGFSSCSPTGLSVANNIPGHGTVLGLNCGNANSQAILFDPTDNGGKGAVIKSFTQFSGGDEDWYDPNNGAFYFTAQNNATGPVLGIVNGFTDTLYQILPTSPGAHSVAVDPVTGDIFMPFGGIAGNTTCPKGCIAVFAAPEPGSLPILVVGLAGLIGLAVRRRIQ